MGSRGKARMRLRKNTTVPAKWTYLVFISAASAFAALNSVMHCGKVRATPAAGFRATTILSGRFDEIDMVNKPIISDSIEFDRQAKAWLSLEKAAGSSDLYIQSNVWQPGG